VNKLRSTKIKETVILILNENNSRKPKTISKAGIRIETNIGSMKNKISKTFNGILEGVNI
jgi:hypothetical protein